MKTQSVPSTIIVAPSQSAPTSLDFGGQTGIPSNLPQVIFPTGGPQEPPRNTTIVQIGFLYPLNYAFVLAESLSQTQIFTYLPQGVAYGLGISVENITMQTLRAYDTEKDLGYITTLALAFIPNEYVDKLSLNLHTPSNKIYKHPDPSVCTLLSMINPALPIHADGSMAGASPVGSGSSSTSTAKAPPGQEGAPIGGGINDSQPVKASAAGIGVGVCLGAAAYGAAMFLVARRYKMRRQSHRRSPSLLSSPVMSGSSPHDYMGGAGAALMSGGRGDGGRSTSPGDFYYSTGYGRDSRGSGRSGSTGRQQISAPVMVENSLGWN